MPSGPALAAVPPRPPPAPGPAAAGAPWRPPAATPGPVAAAAAAVGVAPVAMLPIGTAVVAVNAASPAAAPVACRMNAVTARYCAADKFSPVGGIVDWMNSKRSFVERLRQVLMKLLPASCGASLRPARSAMWQLAQLAAYTVAPVAAWLPLNTGGPGCCPAPAGG